MRRLCSSCEILKFELQFVVDGYAVPVRYLPRKSLSFVFALAGRLVFACGTYAVIFHAILKLILAGMIFMRNDFFRVSLWKDILDGLIYSNLTRGKAPGQSHRLYMNNTRVHCRPKLRQLHI